MKSQSIRKAGQIRNEFPMLAHWTHLNCGGMAPMPASVGAELLRVPQAVINDGPLQLLGHEEAFLRHDAARQTVARFINADPDEIAFTTQFSTSVNIVVEGLRWNEGDEIVVSSEEHPALLTPILNIARRRGVRVLRLPISQDPDAMIDRFREILSPHTRLVAVSHVTTDTGTTLPVEEITHMAHGRGALVLLDAAHSLGQLEVDVRSLDCDFYAMVGYKWVMGPYPSAALFIKRELLDSIDVTWTGSRATRTSGTMMDLDDLQWIDGAQRFEYGGQPFSYHTAMAEGIAFVSSIGVEAIRDHSRHLAALLHDGVAEIPGAHIRSPVDEERRLGIVTIELDSMDGARLSAELRDRFNIITRPALHETSVRFSLAAFIEEDDVSTLVEHLQALAS